jgi:hypothetical protein
MRILNLTMASLGFALPLDQVAADVSITRYEEVTVPVASKLAPAIEHAKSNSLEAYLAVVLPLGDKYEILGMLRTRRSWHVIARIRQTGNLLHSCGGLDGSSFRKNGFGKPLGYHVVRAIDENQRTFEYRIGDEFKDVSDMMTISCDGGELTISTRREQASTGQRDAHPEPKSEDDAEPQRESEGHPR